ncbi:unnamed protein product [Linum tenue]|uniref:MADS-box domain-containing protein n=1 Tax=Linum tenue TaxID=586396 RepID=A0AAV0HK95_9ROSI|nr:unnamed protein product [Linum tenue]
MARTSRGRQKVEMVKMVKDSNRQVTFSKRRSGLFKKASELCTLCGVEIAIIVFSPGHKVFSFGHPSIQALLDRFLARNPTKLATSSSSSSAHRNAQVRELNAQLTQVLQEVEIEKKHGEELNRIRKISQSHCWWEAPVRELGLDQLQHLKAALQEFSKNISRQKLFLQTCSAPTPTPPLQFFGPANPAMATLPTADNHLQYDIKNINPTTTTTNSNNNLHLHHGYGSGFY